MSTATTLCHPSQENLRRLIERLDDYEQHPDNYDDGSRRVLNDSASRAGYINYYRYQAQGYITAAYASLGKLDNMSEDQS